MDYPTEALDRAERTVRDEGEDHYFYIDPNQFALTEADERSDIATGDCGTDIRIDTEEDARETAQRLANFLEYRVVISKFVKCGALVDNFEEDEDGKITVFPNKAA